jgi:hypothetical protein
MPTLPVRLLAIVMVPVAAVVAARRASNSARGIFCFPSVGRDHSRR